MWRWLVAVLAVYLLLAAVVWFGLGGDNLPFFRRMAAEGVRADATVTATDCGKYGAFRYTFTTADGRAASGRGVPGTSNPPYSQLRPGEVVGVWYVPADPAVNSPGDPGRGLRNELITARLAAFGVPAVLLGSVWLNRRYGRLRQT